MLLYKQTIELIFVSFQTNKLDKNKVRIVNTFHKPRRFNPWQFHTLMQGTTLKYYQDDKIRTCDHKTRSLLRWESLKAFAVLVCTIIQI